MKKLGVKDFKINSIQFPKSFKELFIQSASEMVENCTLLGTDPQLHIAGLRSSHKTCFPRIPFKCKALVGGRYATLEGDFKMKEASEDGLVMEMNVVFPDGSCAKEISKVKKEGEHLKMESNLPVLDDSYPDSWTITNVWMKTAGQELKMACMKFLLKTDPKSLKL